MTSAPSDSKTNELLMKELQDKASLESYRILYSRFNDRIYRYIYHIIGNRSQAEDCTHDVFMRVYQKRASFNPNNLFSPWIYRIAKNMALNAIRNEKRHKGQSLQAPIHASDTTYTLEAMLEDPQKKPDEIVASEEIVVLLRNAIQQLKITDRQLVVLCSIERLPYSEVARIMGWSVARISIQLHRAKARLAKILTLGPKKNEE